MDNLPTYRPTHPLHDKNSSDRSTLQQIAFLLRNPGRCMANGRTSQAAACAAEDYSVLIPRKPARTKDPGSVSLLGVTNFPLSVRGEGSEGEVRVGHRSVETIQIKKKPLAFQVSLY